MLIRKLLQFMGKDVTSTLTQRAKLSLANISKNSLNILTHSLETRRLEVLVNIASPVIVLPLLKNNDPASPVWVFRLGNLIMATKDSGSDDKEYVTVEAALTGITLEVQSRI